MRGGTFPARPIVPSVASRQMRVHFARPLRSHAMRPVLRVFPVPLPSSLLPLLDLFMGSLAQFFPSSSLDFRHEGPTITIN